MCKKGKCLFKLLMVAKPTWQHIHSSSTNYKSTTIASIYFMAWYYIANINGYNIITNKKSCLCANLINGWIVSNMDIKSKREMNKFTSQRSSKFTWIVIKNGLSSTIFAINGMCMDITWFVKLNMLIQHVFTFRKILFPWPS